MYGTELSTPRFGAIVLGSNPIHNIIFKTFIQQIVVFLLRHIIKLTVTITITIYQWLDINLLSLNTNCAEFITFDFSTASPSGNNNENCQTQLLYLSKLFLFQHNDL